MKNTLLKISILLLFAVPFWSSCEEDEVPPDIPGTDQPPTAPVLLLPADSTMNLDYHGLNLSWEPGVDPEGGPVTHEVYLDTDEIGIYLGEYNSATDADVDFSLYPYKDYHWFVAAKDSVGNQTSSEVFHFKTRELIYTTHTLQDQMGNFYDNAMTIFNGKVWSVGGYNSYTVLPNGTNDVWSSENGISWVSHPPAAFPPRKGHTLSVFDGKMWVIGGVDNSGASLGDIWYTSDGENWIQATTTGAFVNVEYHNTLVFNNKMFVIASYGIWSTNNGFDWVQESTNPFSWNLLMNSTAVVYNNAIYAMGGNIYGSPDVTNKIFKSLDGSTWQEVTPIENFTPRKNHTAVVYDGKIWILAGMTIDESGAVFSDEIWYSDDPDQFWYLYDGPSLFTGRSLHSSLVYEDEIWLFGGKIYTGPTGEISSFR